MREMYPRNEEIKQLQYELKRKNDLIKEKNHELSSYFFSVSHELKTPINAMSGYLSLLQEYYAPQFSGDAANYVQRIESNLSRMQQLVDDLVEFSRVQINEKEFREISFQDLLDTALSDLQYQIFKKNVQITTTSNFPQIFGDGKLLLRILTNIIGNAIKYSSPNRTPEVKIGYDGDEIFHKFYVQDNGRGIAREDQKNLFQLFSRVDRNKGVEGSGLGLAISKRIIDGHGGEIWVESKKNRGSTFYFTLPKVTEKCPE